jgi:hypothetical protein
MTQQHLIAPSPELVQQWIQEADGGHDPRWQDYEQDIATRAAQWGADQELEACCEVLARELICDGKHVATDLRMIRRPKPPSLKEQALEALMTADGPDHPTPMLYLRPDAASIIRRALEQLDD